MAKSEATPKAPYGTDTAYADPGYQGDGVKRYPIDTEEHVRAAWSYINQAENAAKYSAADLRKVRARIKAAARRFGIAISEDSDDASMTSATEPRYGVSQRNGGSEMSWRIEKRSGKFAIVADADDEVVDAFADRSRAVSLLRRLHATKAGLSDALISAAEARAVEAMEPEPVVEGGRTAPWVGVLTVEGVESGDGRMFGAQGLSWDEPPLPLMWQKETSHGGNTDKSVRVGSIKRIYREPDASGRSDVFLIKGEGTLDLDNEDGAEVFRRMKNGDMRGNSVDVDSIKGADVELVYPEVGEGAGTESLLTQAFAQPELTIYRRGRIRATTMVEIPAFTEARLELVGEDAVTADAGEQEIVVEDADGQRLAALTAATATIEVPDLPPREWFEEPTDVAMDGALTVTAEGRIYGMVAPAGVRHRSFTQRAQYVPLGRVDYDRYHGGQTLVADGGRVATGNITMDCGHATTAVRLTGQQASEHYDNTCSIVATACVGENERGVWIAGALLPDVDAATVRRVMACRLSGDWRTHLDRQGWREFVAALLVPVPGFPMERSPVPTVEISEGELVASSVPVRLVIGDRPVTARSLRRDQVAAISQRVTTLRRAERVATLTARAHGEAFLFKRNQKRGPDGRWIEETGDIQEGDKGPSGGRLTRRNGQWVEEKDDMTFPQPFDFPGERFPEGEDFKRDPKAVRKQILEESRRAQERQVTMTESDFTGAMAERIRGAEVERDAAISEARAREGVEIDEINERVRQARNDTSLSPEQVQKAVNRGHGQSADAIERRERAEAKARQRYLKLLEKEYRDYDRFLADQGVPESQRRELTRSFAALGSVARRTATVARMRSYRVAAMAERVEAFRRVSAQN